VNRPRSLALAVFMTSAFLSGLQPALADWTEIAITVPPASGVTPRTLSDGSGGAIIAWQGIDGLYVHHLLSTDALDPSWPAAGVVVATGAAGGAPGGLISDGAGGAIATWADQSDNPDIRAGRVLASGTVDPSWPSGGALLCSAAGNQIEPRICSDGAGGAIVTWYDDRNPLTTSWDIYAQHVLATGVVDPGWSPNGVAVNTAAGDQLHPSIVSDALGGAVIAWDDDRHGSGNSDIYAIRVRSNGTLDPAWPAGGRQICGSMKAQNSPLSASDGLGGAIITWSDFRSKTNYDAYAMRVLRSGSLASGWHGNGEKLCDAPGDQEPVDIIADGSGGAVIVWNDQRNSNYDVFAARISATGSIPWASNGVGICTDAANQTFPHLSLDGAGGFFVGWQDGRNGGADLYVHHLSLAGSVFSGWHTTGVRASFDGGMGTGQGDEPSVCIGNGGGAIVAWDKFNGSGGIFAMHLGASPPPGVAANAFGNRHAVEPAALSPAKVSIPVLRIVGPNPTIRSAKIGFSLHHEARMVLTVSDAQGRRIRRLFDGVASAGEGFLNWDLTDDSGNRVAAGHYFIRLDAEGQRLTQQVVAIR
jgi:hypothetical protein